MKPDKISLGSWDGNPTALAVYRDGRVLAREYRDGAWREVHAADVATKSGKLSDADFSKTFPGLPAPTFPE